MRETDYSAMFKRKSMRKFNAATPLSPDTLAEIERETQRITPLCPNIRVAYRIVPRAETSAKFGEYCLLFYSEDKPTWLLNAGYLLEQMDLYFAAQNIGACWYGLARTAEKTLDGLTFVIMMAFGKSEPTNFRADVSAFNRHDASKIWSGTFNDTVTQAVRLAPSACNTQPWRYASSAAGDTIEVTRTTKVNSFIPQRKLSYFNAIDMGIALCYLEAALQHAGYTATRTLYPACEETSAEEFLPAATYCITSGGAVQGA